VSLNGLLLISGYKPHLALLGWYNEGAGVLGLPLRGKCITIHGEREKEAAKQKVAAASLRWV